MSGRGVAGKYSMTKWATTQRKQPVKRQSALKFPSFVLCPTCARGIPLYSLEIEETRTEGETKRRKLKHPLSL